MTLNQPRTRPQLGDEAASYVRDQITSGTLAPGAHVRPESVANELNISSTPAREALQALRAEGFLELAPRRGFTVSKVTGDDIRDMFLVQSWVAGELAARAAANADEALIARISRVHDELTAAAERGDLATLEEQNHLFHRDINLASNATKLAWVIQLVSRYAPSRFYATIEGWPETTIDDHAGILDAIRAGDPAAAREAMSNHILRSGEQLARHIDARLAAEPAPSA
ncbi:GntR family transcriptional regulator [Microbacterium sp. NPDC077644]|uniref:GntR family transcriptional regulator n=1 Tax=Microbacterium sp. NPDC077644 TaxID=3155055 RepID=UPI00344B7ACD